MENDQPIASGGGQPVITDRTPAKSFYNFASSSATYTMDNGYFGDDPNYSYSFVPAVIWNNRVFHIRFWFIYTTTAVRTFTITLYINADGVAGQTLIAMPVTSENGANRRGYADLWLTFRNNGNPQGNAAVSAVIDMGSARFMSDAIGVNFSTAVVTPGNPTRYVVSSIMFGVACSLAAATESFRFRQLIVEEVPHYGDFSS